MPGDLKVDTPPSPPLRTLAPPPAFASWSTQKPAGADPFSTWNSNLAPPPRFPLTLPPRLSPNSGHLGVFYTRRPSLPTHRSRPRRQKGDPFPVLPNRSIHLSTFFSDNVEVIIGPARRLRSPISCPISFWRHQISSFDHLLTSSLRAALHKEATLSSQVLKLRALHLPPFFLSSPRAFSTLHPCHPV